MEAPSDLVSTSGLSSYSAEVLIYESWSHALPSEFDEDKMPPEVGRAELRGINDSSVGCHARGTLTLKITHPNLWSAEKVSIYSTRATQFYLYCALVSFSSLLRKVMVALVMLIKSYGCNVLCICSALLVHACTAVKRFRRESSGL